MGPLFAAAAPHGSNKEPPRPAEGQVALTGATGVPPAHEHAGGEGGGPGSRHAIRPRRPRPHQLRPVDVPCCASKGSGLYAAWERGLLVRVCHRATEARHGVEGCDQFVKRRLALRCGHVCDPLPRATDQPL